MEKMETNRSDRKDLELRRRLLLRMCSRVSRRRLQDRQMAQQEGRRLTLDNENLYEQLRIRRIRQRSVRT